jgi:DNA-directed RNA polymerase subunit RPC12/RpoP
MVTMLDANRLYLVHFDSDIPAEVLDLTYTATPFGGRRAWFVCSRLGCGRRVAILHATPKGFRCRHCSHLVYESQIEQRYDRRLRAVRKIRYQLGGGGNLFEPFPAKPKWMHHTKYLTSTKRENQLWTLIGRQFT